MTCCRSSGVNGVSRLWGGSTQARSTGVGTPFSSRTDTRPSPTAKLGDGLHHIELGIGPEGLRGGFYRLLVFGGKGPQGVLDPVAQLPQHGLRQVQGPLVQK